MIESITIVGPGQDDRTLTHRAIRKAVLYQKILTKIVTVGAQQKIVIEYQNNGTIEMYSFPRVGDVIPVTDYVALYLPREEILYSLAEQIVTKKFPKILIPPYHENKDEALERRIKEYFLDNGFKEEQVLMNKCYLNGF